MKKLIFRILCSLLAGIVFHSVALAGDFQEGEKQFYKKNYSEALMHYEKALDEFGENEEFLVYIKYQIAECNSIIGNKESAKIMYEEFIKSNPGGLYSEKAQKRVAYMLSNQKKDKEAIELFKKLGSSNKRHLSAGAYLNAALSYFTY